MRLVVLTDISSLQTGIGEPDDTESLVRLLLYANHFQIEGLIATYTEHVSGRVCTDYIREIVHQYGKVWDNLCKHSPDYPAPAQLLDCIKAGSVYAGMDRIGVGMDTEGSDWIIQVVDKPDSRPVWFTVWGGVTDLAQALWKVKQERTPEEFSSFCKKIRVHAIADQYDEAGPWIRENCPEVFYITSYKAFRGMYRGGDEGLVTKEWLETNICKEHGALGAAYPIYDGGDIWGEVKGIKEGDTPSFLYLIPNGLGNPEHPEWGSWGGRFVGSDVRYFDAEDRTQDNADGMAEECTGSPFATVSRWRDAYQRSFQARMDWCVQSYEEANHEPVAVVDGQMQRIVRPGETITLSAKDSFDPDGDGLSFRWWVYEEASTYRTKELCAGEKDTIELQNADTSEVIITIPADVESGCIHVILEVTDSGEPALTGYARVLLEFQK